MIALIASLTLMMIVVIYFFRLGKIQDQILKRVTNTIKKEYEINLSINSSKATVKDGVVLNDILILDHKEDTLVYLKKLKTNISSYQKLIDNEYRFSKIFLDGLFLKINKYDGEKKNNLEYFIDSLVSRSKSKIKNPFVYVSNFELTNSKILNLINNYAIEIINLKSNNINIFQNNLEVLNTSGEITLKKNDTILFKSESVSLSKSNFSINDYLIKSNYGMASGFIKYEDSIDLNPQRILSKLSLKNINLDKLNLFKTSGPLPNISSEINITGTLDSISLDDVKLDMGKSQLYGDFTLFNLFSKTNFYFLAKLKAEKFKFSSVELLNKNLPESLNQVLNQEFGVDLNVKYSKEKWNIMGAMFSDFGDFKINLFNESSNDKNFISINKFNPSKLNTSFPEGLFTGSLNYKYEDEFYKWFLNDSSYDFLNFPSIKIIAQGETNRNNGNILFSISEGVEIHKSSFDYDFSSEFKKLSSAITLKSFNLSSINQNLGDGKAILSGVFKSKIEGKSIDDSSYFMTVQDVKLEHKNGILDSSDFYINSQLNQDQRNLSVINSSWFYGEAKGAFDISKLSELINNTFSETFPTLTKKSLFSRQQIDFDFTLSKDLVNTLNSEIESTENLNLIGYLDSQKYKSYLDIEIPFFQYQDFFAQGLRININNRSLDKDAKFEVDKLLYKSDPIGKFIFASKNIEDKLLINSKLESLIETGNSFDLNFFIDKISKNEIEINLKKTLIKYNSNDWILNTMNVKPIYYNTFKSLVEFSDINFELNNSSISISGFYNNLKNYNLKLNFNNVNFNQLLKQKNTFYTDGYFNSNFNITRAPTDNNLSGQLISNNIFINNKNIGKIEFYLKGNTEANSYLINSKLYDNSDILLANGNLIFDRDKTRLDLDLLFNNFDISFLSPLGKKSISNIRGILNGKANIWGDINDLNNTGDLELFSSGFSIPYLNTHYNLDDTQIKLSNKSFNILSTCLTDSFFKTKSSFVGNFSHNSFRDWNMDLIFKPEGLLLLNKKETPKVLFYGQGFFSGDIEMRGPTKNPILELSGITAPGTSIKIPWKETKEISDTSYITFVDKQTNLDSNNYINDIQNFKNEIRGLEILFELDINNDAEVEIVIDQSSGSYINGKGVGKLLMETNTNGKFNMWGDFTTSSGVYNFKNIGLLDKKFNLESGGTIVWEGDPLGAKMDLNAMYEVPGGANPAILLDNPSFNKKIPTNVGIHLQGNLLKPDNPIFEILFPNTSGTVVSEINYRLSDPQRSQLQAISLLSQGMFINDVSLSMQGITNNLYEKASDIFTSILGNNDEKLKVGINYLQGDRNSELDIFSEDRLGLTLSTQVSDKILINGKIGVPVGGVNETLIVGDVQIDFILNEDGTLRAKVFNKENEFRYIGDQLGYTQGMGLSYNVDFDSFKELINKIIINSN